MFTAAGASGRVFIQCRADPPGWLVKSVTLDGQDITDVPLDLSGHAAIEHDVRIVLTDKGSDLSGGVTDSRGNARGITSCVQLPAALPSRRVAWQRFIRLVRPEPGLPVPAEDADAGTLQATALE